MLQGIHTEWWFLSARVCFAVTKGAEKQPVCCRGHHHQNLCTGSWNGGMGTFLPSRWANPYQLRGWRPEVGLGRAGSGLGAGHSGISDGRAGPLGWWGVLSPGLHSAGPAVPQRFDHHTPIWLRFFQTPAIFRSKAHWILRHHHTALLHLSCGLFGNETAAEKLLKERTGL